MFAVIDSYDVVNNQFVEYNINVQYSRWQWNVSRRFSDFDALHWALKPLGLPWSEVPLPPKRLWAWNRLAPEFLNERKDLLQVYLDTLMSSPGSEPLPLREFLQVDAHLGDDHDSEEAFDAMDEGHEAERLHDIVYETSTALIDVTQIGTKDLAIDIDQFDSQRLAILQRMKEIQPAVQPKQSPSSSLLRLPLSGVNSPDALLDALSRDIMPIAEQNRRLDRCGLALADAVRNSSKVEVGDDLVCHMQVQS
mmetsp:Transcript_61788/g.84963  ORF Transcript_61788/g.84963 Transcript_61788/m.84963 type:complete len:251 (-) Transcript_61788:261-1013(-)